MIAEPANDPESALGAPEPLCPQCESGQLTARGCELVCTICGYLESCEDSFFPTPVDS